MSHGQLRYILSNPLYIGKLRHYDRIYDEEARGHCRS